MIDESTEASNLNQFITYLIYIFKGEIRTKFLDIQHLESTGQNAENLT